MAHFSLKIWRKWFGRQSLNWRWVIGHPRNPRATAAYTSLKWKKKSLPSNHIQKYSCPFLCFLNGICGVLPHTWASVSTFMFVCFFWLPFIVVWQPRPYVWNSRICKTSCTYRCNHSLVRSYIPVGSNHSQSELLMCQSPDIGCQRPSIAPCRLLCCKYIRDSRSWLENSALLTSWIFSALINGSRWCHRYCNDTTELICRRRLSGESPHTHTWWKCGHQRARFFSIY